MSKYNCIIHTEPSTVDLPVCSLVGAVEQKRHLRWQCVTVPSRSPDVSMHADKCGIMRGMGERGEKNVCGSAQQKSFIGQKVTSLPSDSMYSRIVCIIGLIVTSSFLIRIFLSKITGQACEFSK